MADEILKKLSSEFGDIYANVGTPRNRPAPIHGSSRFKTAIDWTIFFRRATCSPHHSSVTKSGRSALENGDMARLYRQAAVIPFRIRDERVEIALVTTLSGKRWVVPKG